MEPSVRRVSGLGNLALVADTFEGHCATVEKLLRYRIHPTRGRLGIVVQRLGHLGQRKWWMV